MKSEASHGQQGQPGVVPPVAATNPKPQGKKTIVVLTVLIVAGLAVMAVYSKMSSPAAAAGGTVTARRGDLAITVTEGGSIRASKSITYMCEVERRGGNLTILNIVPAGTYVTQEDVDNGMVLVELDSSALKEQAIREKTSLANNQESMTSAIEAYDIQKRQNESDIADNQLKLRFALMALQKYLGNSLADQMIQDANAIVDLTAHVAPYLDQVRQDPNLLDGSSSGQELKRFNDDIVLAEGNLKTAQATLAGTAELHKANYVSNLDLDRDQLTVVNRQFSLENSRVNRDLFLRYDFPKNAEQNLSDYIEAGRQLERTYAQCRSRISQAQARLSSAEESLESQKRTVEWIEGLIEKCTIRAKAPGLVIYGTGGSGDAFAQMRGRGGGGGGIIAAGESVFERQVLISMPDTATMIAEIGVHETEVDKVRPGQTAQIVMDAFPDKVLTGRVTEVAPLPDEQRGFMNPDLKVYKTLVAIDGTHDFLRTRMSCKVELFVQQLQNVILVPIQVVANRKGRKVVFVQSQGQAVEREVKTGAFNDIFVQIEDGLTEGEEVLLNPPLFTESSAPALNGSQGANGTPGGVTVPAGNNVPPAGVTPPAGAIPPAGTTPPAGGETTEQPPQRRGGNRMTLPDGTPITEEMRQQFRSRMGGQGGGMPGEGGGAVPGQGDGAQPGQRMRQPGGGQGGAGLPMTLPDGTPITEEMRQQFRNRMGGQGGGIPGAGGQPGQRTRQPGANPAGDGPGQPPVPPAN